LRKKELYRVLYKREDLTLVSDQPTKTTLEEWRDSFMRALTLENRSPGTVQGVKSPLNIFFRYLRSHGINDVKQVSSQTIEDYRRDIYHRRSRKGTPYAPMTVIQRLLTLISFFKYLKKKGHILVDPAYGLELPKNEDRIPRAVMTEAEMKLILSLPDRRTLSGYRDRTILEVLYATGVRNAELRAIRLADVNLAGQEIKIENGAL